MDFNEVNLFTQRVEHVTQPIGVEIPELCKRTVKVCEEIDNMRTSLTHDHGPWAVQVRAPALAREALTEL